jgi:hypothetical protein
MNVKLKEAAVAFTTVELCADGVAYPATTLARITHPRTSGWCEPQLAINVVFAGTGETGEENVEGKRAFRVLRRWGGG